MTRRPWAGRWVVRLTALVLATYGRRCHLCGRLGATTADHLIPRSQGGPDTLANLRPAHLSCNSARQDMPLDEWFRRHPLDADRAPASLDWTAPSPVAGTDDGASASIATDIHAPSSQVTALRPVHA